MPKVTPSRRERMSMGRVVRGDADPSAAGVGVGVGAAFAGEIGEELQSFAAGGGGLGLFDEQRVGVDFLFLRLGNFRAAEIVSEPLERSTGGEHAAEDAPFSRDGVAHGVDAAEGVARGMLTVGEDDAAGAERGGDDSAGADAVADRAGGLIARSTDDGCAGGKS